MLKRLILVAVMGAVVLGAAALMPGCDVMNQDVDVYVPGSPPGEADEEDEAQNIFKEDK